MCSLHSPCVDPASASPTPTLTVSTVSFKRLHTKNNKRMEGAQSQFTSSFSEVTGMQFIKNKKPHDHETVVFSAGFLFCFVLPCNLILTQEAGMG